ncbi:MAG: hypothetical protein COA79_25745 [Planctomycetota bacterium]|nr:MAG: hypothetical protein COA79_25745 [Planctomycetota bacterium]
MTKEEFKQVFDSGNDEKLRLAIAVMNKEHTFKELSIFACVSNSSFQGLTRRLKLTSNKKRVRKSNTMFLEGGR